MPGSVMSFVFIFVCIFVSSLSPRLTSLHHIVFCVDKKVLHDTISFTRRLSLNGDVYAFLLWFDMNFSLEFSLGVKNY